MLRMKTGWIMMMGVVFAMGAIASAQEHPLVRAAINAVNIDTLSRVVKELSGEQPAVINGEVITITSRDHTGPINYPARYIRQKLESYGYTVHDQHYGLHGQNVLAKKNGAGVSQRYIIVCAHYDAFPFAPEMPGVNDNATGVATVLEAARLFSNNSTDLPLLFAFWDEEEVPPGMLGSRHFADSVAAIGDQIEGVINFEMLGWDADNNAAMTIHTDAAGNSLQLAQSMADVNTAYGIGLQTALINPGSVLSDHSPFWNRGYGALMQVHDVYNELDPNFHTNRDTFSNLNLPYFHKMARLGVGTVANLVHLAAPLPVELSSFIVRAAQDHAVLRWTTQTEVNNFGFEIERSLVSRTQKYFQWTKIGFVRGCGTSQSPNDYVYCDHPGQNGEYAYRLVQIDNDGALRLFPEQRIEIVHTVAFALAANYPNPFNASTRIRYSIGSLQHTSVMILDVLGRTVATLVDEMKAPGSYEVGWNTHTLPSGVYFSVIRSGTFSASGKLLLIK